MSNLPDFTVQGTWIEHSTTKGDAIAFQCPYCQLTICDSVGDRIKNDLSKACPCCGEVDHTFVTIGVTCDPPCSKDFKVKINQKPIEVNKATLVN